ncbi:hypothetical protein ABZ923_37335 [Streptomyces sp. NPDC046881]|uniref:hypothetical protein n=1 Tax=Streptomyces sp. NPDC046881 TaxID=3155374 RepID=UPI0033F5B378
MDTMVIAGVRPVGESVDLYVIYDDGTPAHMQVLAGMEPVLSRPGRFVSLEEYGERRQELQDGITAHIASLEKADEIRQENDFEALIALGVPEDSARRMSGYTGQG